MRVHSAVNFESQYLLNKMSWSDLEAVQWSREIEQIVEQKTPLLPNFNIYLEISIILLKLKMQPEKRRKLGKFFRFTCSV